MTFSDEPCGCDACKQRRENPDAPLPGRIRDLMADWFDPDEEAIKMIELAARIEFLKRDLRALDKWRAKPTVEPRNAPNRDWYNGYNEAMDAVLALVSDYDHARTPIRFDDGTEVTVTTVPRQ